MNVHACNINQDLLDWFTYVPEIAYTENQCDIYC